jgi:hypothetical protein
MPSFTTPALPKHRPIHKAPTLLTTPKLTLKKNKIVNQNFLKILRKIAYPQHPNPTNQMISFLDLRRKQQEASIHCIPSIENMLSEQNIEENNDGFSKSSIEFGFSDQIITENNCEMRVMYLCLLEKIMKKLQHNSSVSQRRKIIRGAWNILAKYCKDMNYQIFANIGTKVEWGLLELINFDFAISPRDKYLVEELLQENNEAAS